MPPHRLGDLTSPGFAALSPKPALLFPIGIVEEHGPHLPLDTDSIQALATCEEVSERTGALVAPLMGYGNCSSTKHFPGSFSLRFDTVREWARDMLDECERHGVPTVAFVSGHAGGGHMRALKLAAEEAMEEGLGVRVLVLSDWDLLDDFDRARYPDVPKWDGHAGAVETSRMMHLRPDLVKEGLAKPHRVEFPDFLVEADASRHFPDGVMGDPTKASAEMGRAVQEHIVARLCKLVS